MPGAPRRNRVLTFGATAVAVARFATGAAQPASCAKLGARNRVEVAMWAYGTGRNRH